MTNVRQIIINSPKYGQKICLIDSDDFELVSQYQWVIEKGRTTFYAIYARPGFTIRMHQLILGVTPEKNGKRCVKVDHIDHNGLNNLRCNIRICTNSQNGANSRVAKRNSTGLKGVTLKWDKRRGRNILKYYARIRVNGKLIDLGRHDNPIIAAKKYNEAALKHFGEFAYLNPL